MEPEDSVDAIIRQAAGREPLLCFPRATENTEQWIQLLHVLDHQGWPMLYPLNLKIQLQKCDKCSEEFCSIVNYRRHIRVHNRFQKLDKKDSKKTREALGAYWDKLSVEEAKEIVSFENAMLEDAKGSSILNALNTVIEKHGFLSIPLNYLGAGAALLDVLQSKPESLPISSEDLFRILDEASEKTCFLGTAVSMQKYVFDGDAGKICLELKNLVACASFLLEQNLTKAWIADKDAESLRCQNQLVEEETAAQKRQDEISKKKNKKKLRQNQQNAKEERHRDEVGTKGNFESTVKTLSPEASLNTYDSETNNNQEKFSSDSPSHVPSEPADTDEGTDGINRSGYTFDTDQNIETQSEQGQSQWRIVQKKAREQRNKSGAEIKKNVDSTLKALSPAKVSLDTYKIGAHNPKKIANDAPSHVPSQHPDTNKGSDGDAQSGKDVDTGIVQKKAREQRIKGEAEIKGNVDSTLKALSPAKISLDTYKIGAHNPKKFANDAPSHVPSQHPDTNEGSDGDAQSWKDVATGIVQKKAREQRNKGGAEIKGNVGSTLEALSPAKVSSDTYKIGAHNPKEFANDAPPHVPSQCIDTNEGSDGDAQSGKDVGTGIVQKKAREQTNKGGAEIKGNIDSTLEAVSPAKISSDTYKIGAQSPEKTANDAPSHVPSQCPDTNEGSDGDAQSGKDAGTDQNIGRPSEHGDNHGDVEVARGKGMPKSEPAVANDLHTNQNSKISKFEVMEKDGAQGDQSVAAIANGDKAKPKPEANSVVLETIAEKEPDLVENYEVLIGSISVNVGNCRKSGGNVVAARKDCMVGNVAKQNNFQDKPIKPELVESGTKQSTVKPQMPTSQLETKDPLPVQIDGTEVDAGYANEDHQDLSGPRLHRAIFAIFKQSFISDLEGGTDPGSSPLPFYIEAANAFLVLRWKEAMSSDHVVLVGSNDSESEPSECKETRDMKIAACQSSSGAGSCNNLANAENKSLPASKVSKARYSTKSGKGANVKNTPKQKTDT